ncbi:MAG TPA: type III restriction-modification system endonuclease [Lactobacillaceae bacterium]|jgi:type III restriction enzyme
MKIQLEELQHQAEALQAIHEAFHGLETSASTSENSDYVYANPLIRGRYTDSANIDIKMETGTGKTYVGTRAMFDLHQQYGLFKFIIVVPTPAIKEGWKSFLTSDYARQHFSQFYENTQLDINVINSGDFKAKSGRNSLPAHLLNFIEGSRLNANTINVLLINADMLRSKSLNKDYDQTTLAGEANPMAALQKTRPIVFIDEPHRFPRDKTNYGAITQLQPEMTIRLGATYPEVTEGRGKAKVTRKDYYRGQPAFDLNAVQSFRQGLVKGIDIYYPTLPESAVRNAWKVDSVTAKELVLAQGNTKQSYGVGDDLAFDGDIRYAGGKVLSSGLELAKGMTLIPGTYTNSYQEQIIADAIEKHFEAEQANFMRDGARVKTLSLFFIDAIDSYRQENGWLKTTFERLLSAKLAALVTDYQNRTNRSEREDQYLDFLRVTQVHLQDDVHAGYFGEDRGTGDEAIAAEVDDILRNKNKLLTFKDDRGNLHTRRFLFSKWTLREGWDNPNVFVIAKLRTSGSENSKLQEVGRGLRLPVDENGQRLRGDFRLSFLIGYDERDFAKTLVGEINQDTTFDFSQTKLTDDMLAKIVTTTQRPELELLMEFVGLGWIDTAREFQGDGLEKLLQAYPEVTNTNGKVRENPTQARQTVKLKKENWRSIQTLWQKLAQRHVLHFEKLADSDKLQLLAKIWTTNTFNEQVAMQVRQTIKIDNEASLSENPVDYATKRAVGQMTYGAFVRQFVQRTRMDIRLVHKSLAQHLLDYPKHRDWLNDLSLQQAIKAFNGAFEKEYAQKYAYDALNFEANTTVYDAVKHDFRDEVSASLIGVNEVQANDDARYLYDRPPLRYDSENPERELVLNEYQPAVTLFGKLPKSSIKVPKYTGGTTTPDFIFTVNHQLHLFVDTKSDNERRGDEQIIAIQKKFFADLKLENVRYVEAKSAQDVKNALNKLI